MSIITSPSLTPPTLDEQKAQFAAQVRTQVTAQFNQLNQSSLMLFNQVFKHPKFKPQDLFDSLGADASQLLSIMSILQGAVNAIVPGTFKAVSDVKTSVNKDGTVSVAAPVLSPTPTPPIPAPVSINAKT